MPHKPLTHQALIQYEQSQLSTAICHQRKKRTNGNQTNQYNVFFFFYPGFQWPFTRMSLYYALWWDHWLEAKDWLALFWQNESSCQVGVPDISAEMLPWWQTVSKVGHRSRRIFCSNSTGREKGALQSLPSCHFFPELLRLGCSTSDGCCSHPLWLITTTHSVLSNPCLSLLQINCLSWLPSIFPHIAIHCSLQSLSRSLYYVYAAHFLFLYLSYPLQNPIPLLQSRCAVIAPLHL